MKGCLQDKQMPQHLVRVCERLRVSVGPNVCPTGAVRITPAHNLQDALVLITATRSTRLIRHNYTI